MANDVVFYSNESFYDLKTNRYQVARIERDVAGYDVVALWPTPEEAKADADKLNAGIGATPEEILTVVASSMAKSNAWRAEAQDPVYDVVMPVRFTLRNDQVDDLKARANEVEGSTDAYSIAQAFVVVLHNDPEYLFGSENNSGRLVGWAVETEWAFLPSDGEVLTT